MSGIGLSELIEKVKADLLVQYNDDSVPFLFVDSVELELQVVFKKDANTGLEIDVFGIGGATLGADVGQENIQTIKVNLSPLMEKKDLREAYELQHPNGLLPLISNSMKALIKGSQADPGDGL